MEKTMHPSENVPTQVVPPPSRLVTLVAPLLLAVQVLVTVAVYSFLPNVVPSHWDASGHVNSYAARWVYVSIMPVISLALYLFLRLIFPLVGPQSRARDWRMSRNILTFVIVGQQAFFLVVQIILLVIALPRG
jgi:uncharacterized membrane protein